MRIGFHENFAGVIKKCKQEKRGVCKKKQMIKIIEKKLSLAQCKKDEKILTIEFRVKKFQEEYFKHYDNLRKVSKLYEMGIINIEGEFINK